MSLTTISLCISKTAGMALNLRMLMPILWRYLLSNYLKVFVLCVASFIAVLLTLRLGEIAYFATLGPQAINILWFALQQIPYVLPIVFPVSALISSVLLVQGLSQSRELTAMRSCGFSLKDILAPVIAAALFLSALNFYIVSELSTTSHHNSGQLKNQLRSVNPLLLLNNKLLMHMKGLYFDTLGPSHVGEFAEDIIFLSPSNHSTRLSLMVAKRIDVTPEIFSGNRVTLLTSQKPKRTTEADERLVIENMLTSTTSIQEFSQLLERNITNVNNDHLRMPQLLVRKNEMYDRWQHAIQSGSANIEVKDARDDYYRTRTEIIRRFSVALAVLSFTILGLAFGISISRNQSAKGIICTMFLGSVYLACFFIAKSFDQAIVTATLLYLLPHAVICLASLWMLRRIAHGVE